MDIIKNEELTQITGGIKISGTIIGVIGGVITFGIGFINGILRPLGCSNSK